MFQNNLLDKKLNKSLLKGESLSQALEKPAPKKKVILVKGAILFIYFSLV